MASHKVSHQTYHCSKITTEVGLTVTHLCLNNESEIVIRLDCDNREACGMAKDVNYDGSINLTRKNCPACKAFLGMSTLHQSDVMEGKPVCPKAYRIGIDSLSEYH